MMADDLNAQPQGQQQDPNGVRDALRLQVRDSFRLFLDRYLKPQDEDDDNDLMMMMNNVDRDARRRIADAAPFYISQLSRLASDQYFSVLMVRWSDFVDFDEAVAAVIEYHFLTYSCALDEALEQLLEEESDIDNPDYIDHETRRKNGTLPTVAFLHVPMQWTVRTLRASHVGHLCSITGTVTRTSQVRPELLVGVFRCNDCGKESEPIEQQFKYTEPPHCANGTCENKRFWTLVTDAKNTVFGDWQKLRVQENANEIPMGCMPRSVEVIVRGAAVEAAKPGDRIIAIGCPIVVPEVAKLFNVLNRREVQRSLTGGQRAMGEDGAGAGGGGGANAMDGATGLKILGVRDLNYKLAFLAQVIADTNYDTRRMTDRNLVSDPDGEGGVSASSGNATAAELDGQEVVRLTEAESARIRRMRDQDTFIHDLASCIAPNVFSHQLVKLGLLLQMIGGVPKRTQENISLRGDINCCIVGDPSTAKSHLLKWVANLVPRGVYTSGKASTAAGLTASITRDGDTGERTIEAGALMLADHGVCCIDEFDKMDISDQVAIHEAMEQQTISIAKAGIKATLNARASVLAALNPIGGKYDRRKPLQKNVAITAPIMSRFDLMFCIVDDGDAQSDRDLAEQIVKLHGVGGEAAKEPPFSVADVQLYIRYARSLHPQLTDQANELIVNAYRSLRLQDALANRSKVFRVTTRLLESIIRLSEATAKVYLDDFVVAKHVTLALELMTQSLTTVDMTQVELTNNNTNYNNASASATGGGGAGRGGRGAGGAAGQQQQQQQQGGNNQSDDDDDVDNFGGGGGTQRPNATQHPQQQQHQRRQQNEIQKQQQQPPIEQQKKVVISAEEYNRTVGKVMGYAAKWEMDGNNADDGNKYPKKDQLVKKVLSRSTSNDIPTLQRERRIIELVIARLMQEGKLVDDAAGDGKGRVGVHPDYEGQ